MIRAATLADLDAVMEIENETFPVDAWSRAAMSEEFSSPHGWYIVDVEESQIVGYAGLRAPTRAVDADVQTIAVREGFRGTGRGRALLRAMIAEARARGAREVFLDVRDDNPAAIGLYESEGFAQIGTRPHYYPGADAVVMKLRAREPQPAGTATASNAETSNAETPSGVACTDVAFSGDES